MPTLTMTNEQKGAHKHLSRMMATYVESEAFLARNPSFSAEFIHNVLHPLLSIFQGKEEQAAPPDEIFLMQMRHYLTSDGKDSTPEVIAGTVEEAGKMEFVAEDGITTAAPDDWAKFVKEMFEKYKHMIEALHSMEQQVCRDAEKWDISTYKHVRDLVDSYLMGPSFAYCSHNPAFESDFEYNILWPLLALWHGPPVNGRDGRWLYERMHTYMTEHRKDEPEDIDGVFNFAAKMEFVEDPDLHLDWPDAPDQWPNFVKEQRANYELFRTTQLGF